MNASSDCMGNVKCCWYWGAGLYRMLAAHEHFVDVLLHDLETGQVYLLTLLKLTVICNT